jgi:hypothetical protein
MKQAIEVGDQIERFSKQYGIEVFRMQFLMLGSYEKFLQTASAAMEEILKLRYRVFVFYDRQGHMEYTMRYLYEKGYRAGDFAFLTIDPASGTFDPFVTQVEREIVHQLDGMVAVYQPIMVGEVG